jgi:hypothetical protein
MCFGRNILPIETNELTVFLLNFNLDAIQDHTSIQLTTLHINKWSKKSK